jgi:CO/xanthine dehydrogenase FAD-binding subunit
MQGLAAATRNRRGIKENDRMKAFGYVLAKDVGHAVALLGEHGARAKILAGGTDLLVELKHAVHNPEIILDVSRLTDFTSARWLRTLTS